MHENKDILGGVIVHMTGHAQRIFTNTVTPQQPVGRQKKGVAESEERKKEAETTPKKRTIGAVSSVASNTRSKSKSS